MPLFSIPSRIDIYHHVDVDDIINKKLDDVLLMLGVIHRKENKLMADLTILIDQVKANTDAEASAILLIQGLAAKIAELLASGTNPAEIQALADQLKASADALGAAVVANTV
jgi:endonuclease III